MRQKRFMSLGLIFVIVGILWLLQEMEIISGGFWGYVLPILIILIGLDMLNRDKNSTCGAWFRGDMFSDHHKPKKERKIVDEQ